jgi:propanol-preferring alcohol dehydrogenase
MRTATATTDAATTTTTAAAVLHATGPIERERLTIEQRALPSLRAGEILVTVRACGVCRTDLNIVEGDLKPRHATIVPGHQIVGIVAAAASGVVLAIGTRVGISWLGGTDGTCRFCMEGRENLCDHPTFTGYDVDGGFAKSVIARADFAHPLDDRLDDMHVAPLLCAGIIRWMHPHAASCDVSRVRPDDNALRRSTPGAIAPKLPAGGNSALFKITRAALISAFSA